MIPALGYLDIQDSTVFQIISAFLRKRLEEPAMIDWALRLKTVQRVERLAVTDLLNRADKLKEPWATAWRLIEESWSVFPIEEGPSAAIYDIQRRLRAGDRSGVIISKITDLVAPQLKVEPIYPFHWRIEKKPRRPKTFGHLLSAKLTSGRLVDLPTLEIAQLTDLTFLKALGSALESAVNHGLEIARRIGWDGQRQMWRLGFLNRVFYTQTGRRLDGKEEPDAYHRGIAPSVKLLHTVIEHIAKLEVQSAQPFIQRWRLCQSLVHTRLWAAAARNPELVAAEQVGTFLIGLDNRLFWDLHGFPEITELRATRFSDLDLQTQKEITKRLRKRPPGVAP